MKAITALVALVLAIIGGFGTPAIAESQRNTIAPAAQQTSMSAAPAAPPTSLPTSSPLPHAASRGRITVYAEAELLDEGVQLAEDADGYLQKIAEDLPTLPTPQRVEVRLVADASRLAEVAPNGRGAPQYAIGVAYPDLGVISVALRRGASLHNPTETLRHELAHLALGAALGDKAPRWLHEGFAYQHSSEWTWARTETLAGMAWSGSLIDLAELERNFPAEEAPASRAYAQSYDFVGFLSRRGRWEDKEDDGDRWPFRRFLAAIASEPSIDDAARKAFGKPLDQLFEEWRDDVRMRYIFVPAGVFASLLWIFAALLLALAWRRRRKQNRARIALWDEQEREADLARQREEQAKQLERKLWMDEQMAHPTTSFLLNQRRMSDRLTSSSDITESDESSADEDYKRFIN